ncbi:hypothetical protein GOQ29_01810 [Clostridium sp. D2Q-14]|uniref:hypothetical protein n=1 Tax=Anaeromonas gelatinilytica TaxID=2683194 RepID=UPI00193AE62E|nr:hypothetical protein [Anaeromonas gelatinilytica]MBS4534349.1 hypothetical protein [Anaeromonas gelatinilytica]
MNKNKKNTNNDKPKYVTLPYDFISFPRKWIPYSAVRKLDGLPRHDYRKQLNGCIKYRIIPKSDLAVEIKEGEGNSFFLAGSQMRGRVRMNTEILSQSYPHFINDAPILFRDIAGDLRKEYNKKLGIKEGIEKSIKVGFLRKDGERFYVIPAQKYSSDKFFTSIKEHRIVNMGIKINRGESMLYDVKNSGEKFKQINKIQKDIDKLSNEISKLREELKEELSVIQKDIDGIFIKKFSFHKRIGKIIKKNNFNEELEKISSQLLVELKNIRKNSEKELLKKSKNVSSELLEKVKNIRNEKLEIFFSKMTERWKLKVKIHKIYSEMRKNSKNLPYQREVFYKENSNGGICKIAFNDNRGEFPSKGYLFNSTNASSKRSHYFIKKSEQGNAGFIVPQNVIEGYKQNIKKFRYTSKNNEVKDFYDIFDDEKYKKLIKKNPEGLIVFFITEKDDKSIKMIGRTPYFKVPYNRSITDILEVNGKSTIGYADALFGFTSNESKELEDDEINLTREKGQNNAIESYKSRLRFSSIDIKGEFNYKFEEFLLPSPFASANAMYLEQLEENKLSTYNDKTSKLNGYKYYHILDKVEKSKKEPESMLSTKGVIKNDEEDIYLEGKIYFNNLFPDELGLLLLSLDIKQILKSKEYRECIGENGINIENSFEQIGGAKPYGYGKVKVEIMDLCIEKKDISFESLILDPMEKQSNRSEYVDAYITKMKEVCEKNYFNYLRRYIKSKQEKDRNETSNWDCNETNPIVVNWYNLDEKIKKRKGYPKEWRFLKRK